MEELSDNKEGSINKINQVFFIVYLLLIFEGALRKWVFPGLSSALFFVKEPFILYIYYLTFKHRVGPKSAIFTVVIIFSLAFFILMNVQAFIYNFDLVIGAYGWRNYCLYAPLAFIMGEILREKDIMRIAKVTCILGIGMAILGYIQYSSPVDSYINKGVGLGETQIFVVKHGIVRPYGTFSFTSGFSLFVNVYFVFIIYNFFLGKKGFLKPILFYACLFAFFTCLAVSGSRGAYFNLGLIVVFVSLSTVFLLKQRQGFLIALYLVVGAVLAYILFAFVFTDQWEIMQERQANAEASEGSIFDRALSLMLGVNFFLNADLLLLGSGIGLGSGGGGFLSTGQATFVLAETEWARHLLETGLVMGLLYIFFRIGMVISLLIDSISALLKSSNPSALAFVGFMAPNLLVGAMTGNGVSYSFTWIFLGITLAVNKIYIRKEYEK